MWDCVKCGCQAIVHDLMSCPMCGKEKKKLPKITSGGATNAWEPQPEPETPEVSEVEEAPEPEPVAEPEPAPEPEPVTEPEPEPAPNDSPEPAQSPDPEPAPAETTRDK